MLFRIGMVFLVVSLGLNGLLAWQGRGQERGQDREQDRRSPGVAMPPTPAPSPAVSPADDGACDGRRQALASALIADMARLNQVLPANVLFRDNAPNEVARARLAPVVEQALGGAGCIHALECKDFVCRIVMPGDPATEACLKRLQMARPLWAYTREGLLFTSSPWVKDPLTGAGGYRKEIYVKLANADGAPIPEGGGAR